MKRMNEAVGVKTELTRSANVEYDLQRWLTEKPHYINTPLCRSTIQRVVEGLRKNGNRSWCLIGPYGSGKSTAVLALSQLLCGSSSTVFDNLRKSNSELIKSTQDALADKGPFLPILISGSSCSISEALKAALLCAIENLPNNGVSKYEDNEKQYSSTLEEICDLITILSEVYSGGGIFVAIDELGKFIEYAVENSSTSEIFVLQMIAELAVRSEKPIVFMTVLHQAFDRYASLLSEMQRDELTKIQGRFEVISFQQPIEQVLALIATVIDLRKINPSVMSEVRYLANHALKIGLSPYGIQDDQLSELLTGCFPLHPLTSLLLGPLFRKLAQNERSIFAFLSSKEPFGFQHFLETTNFDPNNLRYYTPDILYDYILQAYGTSLYQYSSGRKWAQIETALERVVDPSVLELRVIKLIGLLSAIGDQGEISPRKEVIHFALSQYGNVNECLDKLVKDSILVWRSFNNTYRLWDGSDIDIEEKLDESRRHVDESQSLDSLLIELQPPQPLIARFHSHKTGNLRIFDTMYASPDSVINVLTDLEDEKGSVIYFLAESEIQVAEAQKAIINGGFSTNPLLITVMQRVESSCRKAAIELKCLHWVEQNTPELSGDLVARRELASRTVEAHKALVHTLNKSLQSSETIICLYKENTRHFNGWRAFNRFLSIVCDKVYYSAPEIRNELINRDQLSTAASKARRDLLEAMILFEKIEDLKINSFPPQKSIYYSLLKSTKLHVPVGDDWRFSAPPSNSQMEPIWEAWESFLVSTMQKRRPLIDFWDILRRPPFGLANGVIPVLITAMLLTKRLEAAIYVEGSFVPNLTVPLAERFVKNPDRFEVRFCKMNQTHIELLEELKKINLSEPEEEVHVLSVVRPLCRLVAQLPPYSRNTHLISTKAQQVRETILSARDPNKLLFEDLPLALNQPAISVDDVPQHSWIKEFSSELYETTTELAQSYKTLLDKILDLLHIAICPDAPKEATRIGAQERAEALVPYALDFRIKGFLGRLSDEVLELDKWTEAVATLVAGKPPQNWNDEDVYKFELNLSELSHTLDKLDKLAYILSQKRAGGFGDSKGIAKKVGRTAARISEVFKEEFGTEDNDLRLTVLAELIEEWLEKSPAMHRSQHESASAKEE